MSLRHALLALLAVQPMTGYDLTKQFDRSVAFVWHAPHSQIYPELRKLEAAGLVTAQSEPRGARGTKRTYSVTDAGIADLVEWVNTVAPVVPERDAFRLKATYFEYGPTENARRQYQSHIDHHEEQLRRWEVHVEQLENRATALLRRRLETVPTELHEAVVAYKVHVYQGLIDRSRLEIRWARRGLALVDALDAASGSSVQGLGGA
ncbi:MAG TPA: helix-turn-helix transcriptional regulator [Acidimicrobiales bacterium]|nr:helix-turn-helix transcriptional regulator [Acidimicrobiales bacterium]